MDSLSAAHDYIYQNAALINATVYTQDNYNFSLELSNGTTYDAIIKSQDNITWYNSLLFNISFGSLTAFLQRIVGNYRIASLLGIGPVLRGYQIIDNKVLILIVDHLSYTVNYDILRDNYSAINMWLEKIHNVGIYHGNLNSGNLRMNKNNELLMVNFDTMFYRDEKDLPIIIEWANHSVTQSIDQFIAQEAQVTFMRINN